MNEAHSVQCTTHYSLLAYTHLHSLFGLYDFWFLMQWHKIWNQKTVDERDTGFYGLNGWHFFIFIWSLPPSKQTYFWSQRYDLRFFFVLSGLIWFRVPMPFSFNRIPFYEKCPWCLLFEIRLKCTNFCSKIKARILACFEWIPWYVDLYSNYGNVRVRFCVILLILVPFSEKNIVH